MGPTYGVKMGPTVLFWTSVRRFNEPAVHGKLKIKINSGLIVNFCSILGNIYCQIGQKENRMSKF